MRSMLLYLPFVSGLAILVALLVIRLKRVRSNFPLVAWIAAGAVVVQLTSGLFLVALPPRDQFLIGVVSISMAITVVVATIVVYNSIQPRGKYVGGHPAKNIEKMIQDYNKELKRTADIVERERIKNENNKLNEDMNSES